MEQVRISKILSELGLCSRREADEYIKQGLVLLDGRVVDELGTKACRSQKVELNKKGKLKQSKKLTIIDGSLQSKERDVPEYIQLDDKNKSAKLLRIPKFSEVPYPVVMEPSLVIEYYSR